MMNARGFCLPFELPCAFFAKESFLAPIETTVFTHEAFLIY